MTQPTWLAGIRERSERASPGPWEPCGCRFSIVTSKLNDQEVLDICDTTIACGALTNQQSEMNSYFIAAARTDIPRLIKAVEILSEALEFYKGAGPMEITTDSEYIDSYGFTVMTPGMRARAALAQVEELGK